MLSQRKEHRSCPRWLALTAPGLLSGVESLGRCGVSLPQDLLCVARKPGPAGPGVINRPDIAVPIDTRRQWCENRVRSCRQRVWGAASRLVGLWRMWPSGCWVESCTPKQKAPPPRIGIGVLLIWAAGLENSRIRMPVCERLAVVGRVHGCLGWHRLDDAVTVSTRGRAAKKERPPSSARGCTLSDGRRGEIMRRPRVQPPAAQTLAVSGQSSIASDFYARESLSRHKFAFHHQRERSRISCRDARRIWSRMGSLGEGRSCGLLGLDGLHSNQNLVERLHGRVAQILVRKFVNRRP